MLQDLRFALRILRRNPAFSAAAILIVGLGIAATCVIFSFAEAAVFRVLPYRNPSRLLDVTMTDVKVPKWGGYVSAPIFLNWVEHEKGTGRFAASFERIQTLVGGAEPLQVYGYSISEGAFHILGVRPILGRDFLARDYNAGVPPVVILSYPLWQSIFNGRQDVLGRQVMLDGVGYTVVGVMPPDFLTPESGSIPSSFWTPLIFNAKQKSDTRNRFLYVWGRLNAGVSVRQAQAELGAQAKQVVNPPGSKPTTDWRIDVTLLAHEVVKQWRSILILLLGAVGLLLAACHRVRERGEPPACSRQ